ncbi:MAG: STAS domain-containing protein [Chlamydiia bacterium]|nr:STAS domain-containing protein [Chlamydiia bacterium]
MQEEGVSILAEKKGKVQVLQLQGRLDAVTTPDTERKVLDIIDSGEYNLLLNFKQVEYISSAGMRMLLSAAKKAKSYSGKLILSDINGPVLDVLKMSGFEHVLDLVKTEQDAIDKF